MCCKGNFFCRDDMTSIFVPQVKNKDDGSFLSCFCFDSQLPTVKFWHNLEISRFVLFDLFHFSEKAFTVVCVVLLKDKSCKKYKKAKFVLLFGRFPELFFPCWLCVCPPVTNFLQCTF